MSWRSSVVDLGAWRKYILENYIDSESLFLSLQILGEEVSSGNGLWKVFLLIELTLYAGGIWSAEPWLNTHYINECEKKKVNFSMCSYAI